MMSASRGAAAPGGGGSEVTDGSGVAFAIADGVALGAAAAFGFPVFAVAGEGRLGARVGATATFGALRGRGAAVVRAIGAGACATRGVRLQANPMTARDAARMTHGAIAERRARRRGFVFRGTWRELRAARGASLFR
jgi:hypothetical protein